MSDDQPDEARQRYDEELTGWRPSDGDMGRGGCLLAFALWAVVAGGMVGFLTWAAVR